MSLYSLKPFKYSSHEKLIRLTKPNKNILDVGCSKGYLASKLKHKGCFVVGIDNDKEDLIQAEKYCDKVFCLDILKNDIKEKYDIIILGDVIEHFPEPEKVMKKLRKNLNEGGYILISVPNIVNIYARIRILFGNFDYKDIGIFDKTHLRFFTLKTFKKLIRNTNYSLIHIEFTPIPLYVALPNTPKSLLKPFYYLLNILAIIYPTMFAYQFVAKIK